MSAFPDTGPVRNLCGELMRAGVMFACLWASPVFGQSTWTGATNSLWSEATNWNPEGVPGVTNTYVIFDSAGNGHTTIDLSTGPAVMGTLFNPGAAAYTLGTPGQSMTLPGQYYYPWVTVSPGVTSDQTIAADIQFGQGHYVPAQIVFTNNSAATLTFTSATMTGTGGEPGDQTVLYLGGNGTGLSTISSQINENITQLGIIKQGTGTWQLLNTSNNFGGGAIWVREGTLVVTSLKNMGETSSIGLMAGNANTNFWVAVNGDATLRYIGASSSTDWDWSIGLVDGTLATASTATFDIVGGTTLTMNGSQKNARASAVGILQKTGAGTLALNGANEYQGATIISEGVLSANNLRDGGQASSIGASTSAAGNLVFDGGTLRYTGPSVTINRGFSVSGGKMAGIDVPDASTTLVFNSSVIIPATTGGLLKSGPGTLALWGQSYYTGPTMVAGGTLAARVGSTGSSGPFGINSEFDLTDSGTLDLGLVNVSIGSLTGKAGSGVWLGPSFLTTGSSISATFGGVIGGGGGIIKVGSGTQTLTGNNTFMGPTAVQGGGITLAGGSIAASGSISISNNATLAVANNGGASNAIGDTAPVTMSCGTLSFQIATLEHLDFSETIGDVTVTGGYNTIQNAEAAQGATSTLTIASLARTGDAIVNFSGEALGLGTRNRILFTNAPALGEWALYNGVGYAAYDPTLGIIEAAYDDVTRLSSGAKVIYSAAQGNTRVIDGTGTPGAITLNDATTSIRTLTQNATGGPVTIDTAGKTFALSSMLVGTGAGSLTVGTAPNSGNLTSSSGALTLVNYSANDLTVNSTVTGPIAVKMSGTGTGVLAGNNTYTGATTLEQGVLSVATIGDGGTPGNLGAAGNATANIVFAGGTLLYTGAAATTDRGFTVMSGGSRFETAASFQFSGTGINLASGSITICGAGNTTIASIMSGAGALAKDGASTLALQGANTFTGGVTIGGGSVSVTSIGNGGQAGNLGAATNASANLVLDGGTLVYNASGITGSDRGITVTANGGTFFNANAGASFFLANGSPVSIAQSGVFTVDGPGSAVIGNTIFGAGALRKTGDGSLFLDNPGNTFTGGVTISGGTLGVRSISNGGAAGYLGAATADASNLVFDGGTLSLSGATSTSNRSFSITAGKTAMIEVATNSDLHLTGSVPATTGGLTKTGNGTLALAGNMAFAGPATVSAGTLLIDGTLGSGSNVFVAAGATLGGSGTIQRDVYISGTHSPGSSPGVQTIDGAVIYNPGATVDWELVASTTAGRGTNYDGINGNGHVAHFLGATALDLVFNGTGSTVKWSDGLWGANQQWVVYSGFNVSGIEYFSLAANDWADSTGALFSTMLPGSTFSIAQQGSSIVLNYAGVPEPSTYALLALSALALACARRMEKRRNPQANWRV